VIANSGGKGGELNMTKTKILTLILLLLLINFFDTPNATAGGDKMALQITSSAFSEGEIIPKRYTCDGPDVSPDLAWNGVPEGTESLALICDDPDAPMGTWVHWVLFNIPPGESGLPAEIPPDKILSSGARHGINDFRKSGYGGPCPPGGTHRYFFKLYALDTVLDLDSSITKDKLEKAMKGHILAEGQLMGKYKR
jgi:Raf kinase inhibitor-like YbhB/YbcL family protein